MKLLLFHRVQATARRMRERARELRYRYETVGVQQWGPSVSVEYTARD